MVLIFTILRELKDWLEFFIARIPGRFGFFIRCQYFQRRLRFKFKNNRFETGIKIEFPKHIEMGSNSYFGIDCKIYASDNSYVSIGSNVTLNANVMINARGKGSIVVGDNVLIGPNVVVRSNNHNFANITTPIINQGMSYGQIIINRNVWIGSNSVILPNCELGEGSIIAAGAIVTSDVEPYTIVGGVPAKLIAKRNSEESNYSNL
tara:strand:+ start:1112 stop:1729 length:618 start_codon:yes stop_codon:yes gene_type:complete